MSLGIFYLVLYILYLLLVLWRLWVSPRYELWLKIMKSLVCIFIPIVGVLVIHWFLLKDYLQEVDTSDDPLDLEGLLWCIFVEFWRRP